MDIVWRLGEATVKQALYWPHLHEMGGASAYRETRLAVASSRVGRLGLALGPAMARLSKLGRRLIQIARGSGDQRFVPRWPVWLTILSIVIVVLGAVGMIDLGLRREREPEPEVPPKPVVAVAPKPLASKAGRAGAVATVLRPDGTPLAGARVFAIEDHRKLNVQDGVANVAGAGGWVREGRTGADGTFAIPQYEEPCFVFILGDGSYAYANERSLEKSPTIRAKPYARVRGRCLVGTKPVPGRELLLHGWIMDPENAASIYFQQKGRTDPEGRFAFENAVADAGLRVSQWRPNNEAGAFARLDEPVRVEPGATAEVTLGGKGRPVIGRVEAPEGWSQPVDFTAESEASIDSNRRLHPFPLSFYRGKTALGPEWSQWLRSWPMNPEGRAYEGQRFGSAVGLGRDGSFRIEDVPPGAYRLAIGVNGKQKFTHYVGSYHDPRPFGRIIRTFTVPPITGGRTDEPMDLGVLRLRARSGPRLREPAPAFAVTTVEGKRLAVPGDFRGKYLLVDFGTMWDGEFGGQMIRLNAVDQKFGKDPLFAMLSLTFADDDAESRKYVAEKGEPWLQAILGPMENPISLAYGVDDETAGATFLIGPEGTVVARDLWGDDIVLAVGKALGRAVE
jgi:hypothetical protein